MFRQEKGHVQVSPQPPEPAKPKPPQITETAASYLAHGSWHSPERSTKHQEHPIWYHPARSFPRSTLGTPLSSKLQLRRPLSFEDAPSSITPLNRTCR